MAHTGTMIALHPDTDVVRHLAVEGGEAAEDLHVTLAYLKAEDNEQLSTDEGRAALAGIVRKALADDEVDELSGILGGVGRFSASPTSDGADVAYASADLPGLGSLRARLLSALGEAGFAVAVDHDFTPHMTLAYVDEGDPAPLERLAPVEVSFDGVHITHGEERGGLIRFGVSAASKAVMARFKSALLVACVRATARRHASLGLRIKRAARRPRSGEVRLKSAEIIDRDKRLIGGWVITYRDPFNPDREGEVNAPGSYTRAIAEHDAGTLVVKVGDSHGRYVGVWLSFEDSDFGVYGICRVERSEEGDAFLAKFDQGTYDSFSAGYFARAGYLHPKAKKLNGEPVFVLTDADLFEISGTGAPMDTQARMTSRKAAGATTMRRKSAGAEGDLTTKGAALAQVVNGKIEVVLNEEDSLTREQVIAGIAEAAAVEVAEVEAILSGENDAPEERVMLAIAELLSIDLDTLEAAADVDQDEAEDAAEAGEEEGDPEEKGEESIKAADAGDDEPDADAEAVEKAESDEVVSELSPGELTRIAEGLEAHAAMLRRMAALIEDQADVKEIPEEDFRLERAKSAAPLSPLDAAMAAARARLS